MHIIVFLTFYSILYLSECFLFQKLQFLLQSIKDNYIKRIIFTVFFALFISQNQLFLIIQGNYFLYRQYYKMFRMNINDEQRVHEQLKKKLQAYKTQEKQNILSQITLRRQKQLMKELSELKSEQLYYSNQIQDMDTLRGNPIQYKSAILTGQDLIKFEESFHFNFSKERQLFTDKQEEYICSICTDKMEENHQASKPYKCKHIFHTRCIEKWFDKKGKYTCPNCRSDIQTKSVMNIEPYYWKLEAIRQKMKKLIDKQRFLKNKFKQYMFQ